MCQKIHTRQVHIKLIHNIQPFNLISQEILKEQFDRIFIILPKQIIRKCTSSYNP